MDNNKFKCPIESLSNILGKKWVFNIIWFLREDKKRFGEIQKYLEECSRKVLSQQLDLLIDNNILVNEKQEINNNVESYRATWYNRKNDSMGRSKFKMQIKEY